MILRVLGSSSSGNSYLLQAEKSGEVLALEAGIRFDKVKKALDFGISRIVGCCVTHEHGDHARYVRDFLEAYIPVYMSVGTCQALRLESYPQLHTVQPLQSVTTGAFKVMPFDVQHDAAAPYGWLIRHEECGNVLFATDTYYLKYRFANLSNILIECNYRLDLLQENEQRGLIDHKRYERTVKSHMSYETCVKTLLANDLGKVNNIVLIHMSKDNGSAAEFASGIHAATGKNVQVATAGMEIELNKTPY